jgi:DNA-binding NarL/FixJ family response regulator
VIRVLLADDQALVRTGFRMILGAEPDLEVVGEAGDGEEAVEAAERLAPDVVLMDIRMPRLNGIEATRRVLRRAPARRVLILTTFDQDEYVYEALRAGASGFLLKTAPADQLVAGVRTVADGDALLAPEITRRLIEAYTGARSPAPAPPPGYDDLTAREREVLGLLARGLTNAEIAAELVVEPSTVKSHVAGVLQKLGVRDRIGAVVLAYECGLVRPRGASDARGARPYDRAVEAIFGASSTAMSASTSGGSGRRWRSTRGRPASAPRTPSSVARFGGEVRITCSVIRSAGRGGRRPHANHSVLRRPSRRTTGGGATWSGMCRARIAGT